MSTQTAQFSTILLGVQVQPGEIGSRIRAGRQAKGWTQLQFAIEAGVSPATIQRWERGQLPRVGELMRVAELLGLDAEQLVEPPANQHRQDSAELAAAVQDLGARIEALEKLLNDRLPPPGLREAASG